MQIDPKSGRAMRSRLEHRKRGGSWMCLVNQLLALAGPETELVRHQEKPWASVTFSGTRHTVCLSFAGNGAFDTADDFIAALPDHEFAIPRHVVIDATITSVDQQALPMPKVVVVAELLLLEDG